VIILDNIYKISLLLDFYGNLLTRRQYEVLDLHYNSDYSLGEIAEFFEISRQGVYDNIRRGKILLNEFEKKLGLIKRFSEQKSKAEDVLKMVNSINTENISSEDREKLRIVKEGIQEIINGL